MDNATFWKLYNNGELENVKNWIKEDCEVYEFSSCITSFKYNGKYYLRFSLFNGFSGWWGYVNGKREYIVDKKSSNRNSFIKCFDNATSANNYFRKAAADFKIANI